MDRKVLYLHSHHKNIKKWNRIKACWKYQHKMQSRSIESNRKLGRECNGIANGCKAGIGKPYVVEPVEDNELHMGHWEGGKTGRFVLFSFEPKSAHCSRSFSLNGRLVIVITWQRI